MPVLYFADDAVEKDAVGFCLLVAVFFLLGGRVAAFLPRFLLVGWGVGGSPLAF